MPYPGASHPRIYLTASEIARLTASAARHLFNAWVQDSEGRRTELGRLEGQLSALLEEQGAEKLYERVFETVAEIEQHVFILAFEAGRRFAAGR